MPTFDEDLIVNGQVTINNKGDGAVVRPSGRAGSGGLDGVRRTCGAGNEAGVYLGSAGS
jgi:hypothetical protein